MLPRPRSKGEKEDKHATAGYRTAVGNITIMRLGIPRPTLEFFSRHLFIGSYVVEDIL
jgi:hypothetical protein